MRIFYAGDSTVQYNDIYTYPQTGLGQVIGLFFTQNTQIFNYGRNGRSTKSFIAEGRLKAIEAKLQKGDLLLVQFGHNDEKDDPNRGTRAFGDFQDNLQMFIDTAKNKGALPVLITPLYRRHFDESGRVKDNVHLDYPDAMKAVAEKNKIPCIDLCQMSKEYLQQIGDDASKALYMNFPAGIYRNYMDGKEDNTHMRYEGAIQFAGMIVDRLSTFGKEYSQSILQKREWEETEFTEKDVD